MAEEKKGWFKRLKEGLSKSTTKISTGITTLITHRKLDQATLDDLEELLISSDLGVETSAQLIQTLSKKKFGQDVTDEEIKTIFAEQIAGILEPAAQALSINPEHNPYIILVVGVNGSGKTTTIGKFAKAWMDQGKKVSIEAAPQPLLGRCLQLQC